MTKAKVSLIIENANELVTLQGFSRKPAIGKQMRNLSIIHKGSVAVEGKRIVAVDTTQRIRERYSAEETIDATGKTVLPGFVDAHTHLVFAGAREEEFELRIGGASYMEILARGGGILRTVRETRKASIESLVAAAEKTLNTMTAYGTTTVEAKSGYGLTVKDELKCLEAIKRLNEKHPVDIVPTFLGAHAVPPEYENDTDGYVEVVVEEMLPKVAERRLAEFCDVFCEKGVFNLNQSRRILEAGRKHGFKLKIHADELAQFGGAELAAELKTVSASHLIYASENGLECIARTGVAAELLPLASFSLMIGRYAQARKMVESGVTVALATDYNPSCWTESLQLAIAFACREMRLTPAEAITAATINAAHAVDRAAHVGSLEEGKKADIIILDAPNHNFLGYRFGTNLMETTIKSGKIVAENGRFIGS